MAERRFLQFIRYGLSTDEALAIDEVSARAANSIEASRMKQELKQEDYITAILVNRKDYRGGIAKLNKAAKEIVEVEY